jgi:hypothetical protein
MIKYEKKFFPQAEKFFGLAEKMEKFFKILFFSMKKIFLKTFWY